MADSLDERQARERFLAVSRGRRVADRSLDLPGAKRRLREADPGLDIGPALRHLGEGRWGSAGLDLLPWLLSEDGRGYLAPLTLRLLAGLQALLAAFGGRRTAPAREAGVDVREG